MNPEIVIGTEWLGNGTAVVCVEGELDMASAGEFKQKLLDALNGSGQRVIVDLSGCSFIDSSGLTVLAHAGRVLDGGSARLVVVAGHPHVLKVFEITHLDDVVALFPDREAALNGHGTTGAGTGPMTIGGGGAGGGTDGERP